MTRCLKLYTPLTKLFFRIESEEEIVDLNIDNGKKSKRLLTVIGGMMSTYADGWANGNN